MAAYTGVGGADLIDIMAGGIPDDSARQWLQQKAESVRTTLTHTGQAFFNRAREMYNVIAESQAVQILRNLQAKREDVWNTNRVAFLHTLAQIQTAGPVMQRWIMAQPELRQRYLDQTVDGFSNTYVNYHGNTVGEDHFDYRRVMTGVVQVRDESDRDFVIQHFFDMLAEEESELTVTERIDILNTWDRVKHYLEEGDEDPTSVYGAQL